MSDINILFTLANVLCSRHMEDQYIWVSDDTLMMSCYNPINEVVSEYVYHGTEWVRTEITMSKFNEAFY